MVRDGQAADSRTTASRAYRASALRARSCLLLTFLVLGSPALNFAQPTPTPDRGITTHTSATKPAERLPSAADAMKAYELIRRAVDESKEIAVSESPRFWGACVELRLTNPVTGVVELVGRGQAFCQPDGFGSERVLRDACDEAIRTMDSTIERAGNEVGGVAAWRSLRPSVQISLELFSPLTPITPTTAADLVSNLSPGIDGLAISRDTRVEAWSPARLLTTNRTVQEAMEIIVPALTGQAADALSEPSALRKTKGLSFMKFQAVHLAQTAPKGQPIFLNRGSRTVERSEIDSPSEIADRTAPAARWLTRWLNTNKPSAQNAASQSLVLFALSSHVCRGGAKHASEEQRASQGTVSVLVQLRAEQLLKLDPSPTNAALILGAVQQFRGLQIESSPEREASFKAIETGCLNALSRAISITDEQWATVGKGPAALTCWALLREIDLDAALSIKARERLKSIFATTEPGGLVAAMPWAAWAATNRNLRDEPPPAKLREMRSIIADHQLSPLDAGATDADLVGGIVFTTARTPLPSWHSARALAALATMAADERLTPADERARELSRLVLGLRFLAQLQVTREAGWYAPNLNDDLGGFRASPWQLQPGPEPTAMALLTFNETLDAIERLSVAPSQAPAQAPSLPSPKAPTSPAP